MNWYYNKNGQTAGPLEPAALLATITAERLSPATLVWQENTPQWLPLAQAEPLLLAQAGSGRCTECGQVRPADHLVQVKQYHVCVECKETFLRKLEQGAPVGGGVGLWRRKKELVVLQDAPFPSRCVKCNDPVDERRLKRQLYWHHPALYLLIFFPGLLIYLIIAICVRKRANLFVGLCDRHRARRNWSMAISWLVILGSIGCFFLAAQFNGDAAALLIIGGIFGILIAAVVGVFMSRVVYAKRIDGTHAYVGGASPAFLETLPEWWEN
jgi:hypothetical protein